MLGDRPHPRPGGLSFLGKNAESISFPHGWVNWIAPGVCQLCLLEAEVCLDWDDLEPTYAGLAGVRQKSTFATKRVSPPSATQKLEA